MIRSIAASIALTTASLLASFAHAQDYLQYPSVRFPYEEGNSGVDYMEMYKTASIKTGLTRERLPHALDQKFGDDVKQRLDVYMPVQKPTGAPVFLFIHGGAFEEGDRAHYGYVAAPLALHGIVTAVTSYRLVNREPSNKITYAEQEDDIKHAIIWIYRNIAQYGGDPNKIYIGGHSAGAVLSANLGVDRKWLSDAGIPQTVIRGVAAVSGAFRDVSNDDMGPVAITPELKRRMDATQHLGNAAPRFVLACGEKEIQPSGFITLSGIERLRSALAAKKVQVAVAIQPGADHSGAVLGLGDEYSPETQAILKMILE